MGSTTVCDKVCLGLGGILVSSPVIRSAFLVDETPMRGFMTVEVPWEDLSRQIRGVQRKPLPASAIFQVPAAQNN